MDVCYYLGNFHLKVILHKFQILIFIKYSILYLLRILLKLIHINKKSYFYTYNY